MTVRLTCQNDKATLSIQGRFDFNVHGAFRKCTEEALALPDVRTIEVNLLQVSYLDSSALGMLLLLREKAANADAREVTLAGVRGMVQQVLDVANFSRLFKIR